MKISIHSSKILFSCLFGLAAIATVTNGNPNNILDLTLEELLMVRVEGPTLTLENLETTPASISVYTQNEIGKMGIDSLDELLNIATGFQAFRTSNSSIQNLYSSRGRRISGTGSEMLLLIDGQRIDSPRVSGSNVVAPKIPLSMIDQVELIRGPGSAVYGSNAMMGVINIKTRSQQNEIKLGVGSFNRLQAHVLYSENIGDLNINFFANVDQDDGDSYRVPDTFSEETVRTKDPRTTKDVFLKFDWNQTQINFQHYAFNASDFYESGYLANGINERNAEVSSLSIKQSFQTERTNSYLWLSQHQAHSEATVQVSPKKYFAQISIPASDEALILDFDGPLYKESRIHFHNDLIIDAENSVQWGIEYRRIEAPDYFSTSNYDMEVVMTGSYPVAFSADSSYRTIVQEASSRRITGIYGQYQHKTDTGVNLTISARYDEFSGIGSEISPRLALIKSFSNSTFKLLFGRAFRAPTESELHIKNNPAFSGNPNLEPETVDSVEAIWISNWDKLNLSIGYFENHYDSTIAQVDLGHGFLQFDNFDDGNGRGVELDLYYQFSPSVFIRANHTEILEKPDLSYTEADRFSSIVINYQKYRWNTNIAATYCNERELPALNANGNRIKIDSYWQVHAKTIYNITPDWECFLQVKNLLGSDYQTPPITSTIPHGIPARGKEILIGSTWSF